jgi:hypothetical protein
MYRQYISQNSNLYIDTFISGMIEFSQTQERLEVVTPGYSRRTDEKCVLVWSQAKSIMNSSSLLTIFNKYFWICLFAVLVTCTIVLTITLRVYSSAAQWVESIAKCPKSF